MNISQIKRLIPLAHEAGVTTRMVGRHGEGKSQCVAQVAVEKFDGNLVDIRLGQMDVGDLLGLADFQLDSKGNKVATRFFKPNWWPQDKDSKGIIFLDELSRARPDVLQAVFQLVLDRKLHGDLLPAGWAVVTADNPATDDYDINEIFDEALLDRFLQVKFQPTNVEFFEYARTTAKFNLDLLGFLSTNEDVLVNPKLKDFNVVALPSKRSWDTVNRLIQIGIDPDMFLETVGGMVGIENAPRLKAYMEQNRNKPFTGEEILKSFGKIKEDVIKYGDIVTGRHEILTTSCDNLTDYLFTKEDLTKKETENLYGFIEALPMDIGYGFFQKTFFATKEDKKMSDKINDILDKNTKYDDIIMNDKYTPPPVVDTKDVKK